MIAPYITSSSGSTQTTATSCDQFSSFSNQPSSRYPIPPNPLPYDPLIPAFFLPVQQHVLLHQQSFPPNHPRQNYYTFNHDSTITTYHSLAPPSPPATTPSGVTASPSTPAHQHPLSPAMQHDETYLKPTHQHPLSPAMQRYVTYLKAVYKNKSTPVYDKEHSLLQVKAKSFINIALVHKKFPQYMSNSDMNEMIMDRLHGYVDAIQQKKTKLHICNVCKKQKGDPAHCVLVEGAPGVGKTTFAYELSKRWARGEILWEWAAVVLIKLRDHRTRRAQNINDLLYHPRPEVKQAVADELIDHNGGCILLILDGYDELTDSQKESTSVIQQIMSRELLCQSTLMVTSRPLATRTLHDNFVQSIDQHIEVLGFTDNNVEEYIQSACGDKPELVEDFKSYLSCHPFSSALMFNPLQCAIVTDLYRSHWEHGDKGFAPKTLTELYTGLVHIMLLRYLTQHPVYNDRYWRIKDLSDLPEEVSQQLKAVAELAAEGIKKRQYVFDEINTNIPSETLGLMQKEEVVASGIGMSTSHNFLHLTLQEYLAAVNYSQQCSSPEQLSQILTQDDLFPLNNFLEHYGKERKPKLYSSATHWPVVLFVAGRTKLSGVPTNIFKIGLHDSDDITTVNVSLLHLLYETQSPQLIQSTLVTSRKYLSVSGSSALDWFVIGYCIANSTSTWRVEKKCNDSPKYFDQLVMGLRLGPEECSGECKIGSLHISGHWAENLKILTQLQPYATSLTKVNLVGDKQREQRDLEKSKRKSVFEESAQYPMLEELTIDNVESSYSASLLTFISQHSNLHILSLNHYNLSSIATSSLVHFLQSPNNRLHKLALDHCTIQIPDRTNSVAISDYQLKLTSPTDTGNFSLQITGSLYAVNYMLSQPDLFYANTLSVLKVAIVSETTDALQTSLYPNLVTLEIVSKSENNTVYLRIFPFSPHENNIHTLSLTRCHLSNECVRSLICFLQSPNNRVHKLTLDHCTIRIPDHANPVAISDYQLKLTSPTDTGNFSLQITGSLFAVNYMLSQPDLFYANTLTILKVTIVTIQAVIVIETTDALQTSLYPNLVTLEIVSKSEKNTVYLHVHIFPFSPHENNIHTLSLTRCHLSNECVRSLICFLQSPNNRLHKLTLDHCTIQIPDHANSVAISDYQLKLIPPTDTGNFSLEIAGSLHAVNYFLSQPDLFYGNTLTILKVVIVSGTTDSLQINTSLYLDLKKLQITSKVYYILLNHDFSFVVNSQQNNLILSVKRCSLTCDSVRSLIHSLQSSHCGLQELTLDDCIFDQTHTTTASSMLKLKSLDSGNVSLEFTGYCCDISHRLSQLSSYTQLTDLILHLEIQDSTTTDIYQEILLYHHVLESLKMDIYQSTIYSIPYTRTPLPLSIPQLIGSQQDLALKRYTISLPEDSTQSPHCKLQNLALKKCTISLPEGTQQTKILAKMNLALHSLDISWSVLDQMMSCINPFTQSLTELVLHVDNDTHTCTPGVETILQEIPSNCPLLKTLKIDSDIHISFPLSIPWFIGSQQNNFHTLTLYRCIFSSDVTRSLIHSLQSQHCRLYKLALYYCTIPTTDHTQLTTAIVSNTTITNLLFIDRNIDTPSLTALASGLKHNTTIEQLAVDKFYKNFTEEQFQLLIDAVDSSAVNKLWLNNYSDYKRWFNSCTLSRKNVKIEWYSYYQYDLYNKW